MNLLRKHFRLLVLSFIIISCNNENAGDCIQTEGDIIEKTITITSFEEIIVNENIELYIVDNNESKIIIEGGKNLITDIDLKVTNNSLEITNNNTCFFTRGFKTIKVYVYASNITTIRNSSNLPVYSIGVLNYPSIHLISENYLSDYLNSGDFNLEVNTTSLSITANGSSNYIISGVSTNLNINFAGENPRFEGEDLITQNATLFARSTNDIIIHTTDEINGNLYSTGDVILVNKPNTVNLNAFYTGQVIIDY